MAERVVGFVLTGGQSERMGRDKALLAVGGLAMAVRVARALEASGAERVVCIGGDVDALGALGLTTVADEREGTGPLGGAVSAMATLDDGIAIVAPCDLLDPRADSFAVLVQALADHPDATVAVPVVDGRWRSLPSALRARSRGALQNAFEAGERALFRAYEGLERVEVDAGDVRDVDRPEDLPDHR